MKEGTAGDMEEDIKKCASKQGSKGMKKYQPQNLLSKICVSVLNVEPRCCIKSQNELFGEEVHCYF